MGGVRWEEVYNDLSDSEEILTDNAVMVSIPTSFVIELYSNINFIYI